MSLFTTIFGDPNEKHIRRYRKSVELIKEIETIQATEITTLEAVQAKTREFQEKFVGLDYRNSDDHKRIKEILEEIKFEALALHRTACRIIQGQEFDLGNGHVVTWNMVPFDVQLMGALALHEGNISEMKT
jgi:preprotein translocase subunit SecA